MDLLPERPERTDLHGWIGDTGMRKENAVCNDGRCPWCGQEVEQFGESWDAALEGHVTECEVFQAELGTAGL
jgi:hypothetical protein